MEEEQVQEVDDFFDYGEETEDKPKAVKSVKEEIDDSDSDIDVDTI